MRAGASSTAIARRVLFGSVIALYVLAFPYHPGLRSPNELCRLHQTRALVEYGTIDINQAVRDFGMVGDLSKKDGKLYPSKAPLLSFAAVPLYWVLKLFGGGELRAVPELPLVFWSRLFFTVLPTLGMLILVRRFLRAYLSEAVADGLMGTYALGSLAFSYSLLFMSHQTTAVLVFAAFYVLWRVLSQRQRGPSGVSPHAPTSECALPGSRSRERGAYLLAGALCGATIAAEYTGALPVLAVVLYGVIAVLGNRELPFRGRLLKLGEAMGLATLGALPFVLGLMAYHQAAFGHPLHSGYKYLNDAAYQPWHMGGFLGIRFPDPRAFFLSFFSPLRGLFVLAPAWLLAFPGIALMWQWSRHRVGSWQFAVGSGRAPIFWLTVLMLAGYTYFTASFTYDSWGWTTGPRHLTPLVPFLLLPAGLFLEWLRDRTNSLAFGAAVGLCVASILVTGLATFVNYIPDDVSNPVFALALPLFRDGFLPPSVFSLIGIPNPWAGISLIVLLVLACGGLFLVLNSGKRAIIPLLAGIVVCSGVFGLHFLFSRNDRADLNAQAFLRKVWLARPGEHVTFWP